MKEIQLTQNKVAIVDDEDFNKLNQYKWFFINEGFSGYVRGCVNKKLIFMHRFLLNPSSKKQIDHRNGNGLDNRKSNLRICTQAENLRNRKIQKNNTSGFRGVYLLRKKNGWSKWRAKIQFNNKRICLGLYDEIEDAVRAYNKAAIKYFGEFARLNII